MKNKLPVGWSVVIALLLVAFGLLYGTWMGYREDRAEVTALLEAENGLMDVLAYRAADGFNLCVVARRHLNAEDESLIALESASRSLQTASALEECNVRDKALAKAVSDVSSRLQSSPSFQSSERDQRYLAMLMSDLNNLSASAAVTTYNESARAFNEKLNAPLAGALARLMGIAPCTLYQ